MRRADLHSEKGIFNTPTFCEYPDLNASTVEFAIDPICSEMCVFKNARKNIIVHRCCDIAIINIDDLLPLAAREGE